MNRKDFLTQSSLLALAGTMLPLSSFAHNDEFEKVVYAVSDISSQSMGQIV